MSDERELKTLNCTKTKFTEATEAISNLINNAYENSKTVEDMCSNMNDFMATLQNLVDQCEDHKSMADYIDGEMSVWR